MEYGHIELFQLLNSNDPKRLLGYIITEDGIWIDSLSEEDRRMWTPDEISGWYKPFRAHDMTFPVLKFPCTGKVLALFLKETGFDAMIIEDVDINTGSDEELTMLMLQEQVPLHEIAARLKRIFPEITAHRLGILLPANPGANISTDAHKKQGQRLLKKR